MYSAFFEIADHDAAGRVDDGLGHACRAGGVADQEGLVEPDSDKVRHARGLAAL